MVTKLQRQDLLSLEQYESQRSQWQQRLKKHKQSRRIAIGPHASLYFEDRLTMWYQVQEMLRAEKIFDAIGIQQELDTYNPLIPDGNNWKATLMLEYEDERVRRKMLQQLVGIEQELWLQVAGCDKVYGIADEDLERSDPNHTSAVHFIRFQFTHDMIVALGRGAEVSLGISHPHYDYTITALSCEAQRSLCNDLREDNS